MKIIAVYNNKGGCGKTSTLINLAYSFAEVLNKKVLVIDTDGQGNTSSFFGADENTSGKMENVLCGTVRAGESIQNTRYKNIDIIPCGQQMKEVELIVNEQGEEKTIEILQNIRKDISGYDFALIDMSPFHNNITEYLLALSHYVLVPCDVGRFSLEGIGTVYETVNELGAKILGLVITRYNKKNTLHNQIIELIKSKVSGKVFEPIIKESNIISNSVSYGLCAYEYNKRFVSADFVTLADNIIKEIERG